MTARAFLGTVEMIAVESNGYEKVAEWLYEPTDDQPNNAFAILGADGEIG